MITDKRFISPSIISPFFGDIRIPRKFKKKVKKLCGIHWVGFSNGERLWYYLGYTNAEYRTFIICQVCERERIKNETI